MFTLRTLDASKVRISFITAILAVMTPLALQSPARAATAVASQDEEPVYQGEAPYRYASVKVLDGDVRIRKGDTDETLSRGMPIAEGDVVDSRGRGVLQLGDGTRVAFGRNTHFTVAALFSEKDGSRQVLLQLDRGRLRVNYGADSEGRIRIDTPSGTAVMDGRANMSVEVDSDRSVKVHVASGRITFSNERDQARILAGERLTIYSGQDRLDRVRSYNTYDMDDFDTWSDGYLVARRSASWDNVPADVRYYSDDLDDNGSWVDVPEVGRAWRPRVAYDDWRPYSRGRWGAYSGGMTWVSDEPWGYLTYHFGRWGWGASFGWYWIPGSSYSPAWVAWNYSGSYYGWAPLGYYNQPCGWGYGAWNGYHAWNVVNVNYINTANLQTRLISDHNVIAGMSGGTGITTWNAGGRSLTPPWRTTPLIATRTEFRNPTQLGTAFNRATAQDRLLSYQRAALTGTGRTVNLLPPGPRDPSSRVPFENRTSPGAIGRGVISRDGGATRFVDRVNPTGPVPTRTPRPPNVGTSRDTVNDRTNRTNRPDPSSGMGGGRQVERPVDRPNTRTNDRPREDRPTETPRDRNQDRPRETYRDERPTAPRDRPVDRSDRPTPREEPAAPRREAAPAPREYRREERPAPRQESQPSPRQESQPSRQESHPAPRQESQPSRQESHPAPRQESQPSAPSDRGRGESRRG